LAGLALEKMKMNVIPAAPFPIGLMGYPFMYELAAQVGGNSRSRDLRRYGPRSDIIQKRYHMMKIGSLVLALIVVATSARASFFDRADYFDNKESYDKAADIIEILYDQSIPEKERDLRLLFKDQKLVPVFKALKIANEKIFVNSLKSEARISDNEIERLMKERPVIDGLMITLENDFIVGTDVAYTNGVKIELSFNNPEFERFFKGLGFDHSDFYFLCGQNIYNTSQHDQTEKLKEEPPNAGVLYCGSAVNSYKLNREKARIDSMQRLEVQVGSIGKSSYAAQIQNGFHSLIGNKKVNWDYQVGDRFYFNINFQKYKKIAEGNVYGDSKPEYNVIVNAGGNAGTFTNYANAGVVFNYRLLGTLIDMYVGHKMTPTLAEELSMLPFEQRFQRLACNSNWSINLYLGASASYILNNYRIDGSSQYNTDITPFVYDLKAGVVVRYKNLYIDAGYVFRSQEWQNTNHAPGGTPHSFGMISITYRYDSFKDVEKEVADAIAWITDPAYRRRVLEEKKIKSMVAKEGMKIVFAQNDPKAPPKVLNLTCNK